jgi:hypothetical protein
MNDFLRRKGFCLVIKHFSPELKNNEREVTMNFRTLAAMLAILAFAASGYAGAIESANLAADGDGVITCALYNLVPVTPENPNILEYELGIYGDQHSVNPGHILGNILVPTNDDPKLTLLHDIDNDTDQTWTDYHAHVTMSKPFTFDNVTVANLGWTSTTTQPTQVGSDWIGYIDYVSGTPVNPGATLSFGYRMTFVGSAAFSEALTPSVPEPSTLALVIFGMIGLIVVRRRSA